MGPPKPARIGAFSPEVLETATDGFSEENCIGRFQFGKYYRGVGEDSDITVKVFFDKVDNYEIRPGDNQGRVEDEFCLAHDDYVISHPNIGNFKGVSYPTQKPAVVYEITAMDTLHNLIDKDSFSWLQRVKVANGIASSVAHMHSFRPIPYIIRNISAAHILVDENCNPKLCDFSMISGGNLTDKRKLLNQYVLGCHGYVDPDYNLNGKWSEKCDVFAFGVVLIGLLSKRVGLDKPKKINPEPFLYEWACTKLQKAKFGQKFYSGKFSLVHQSLEAEAIFCIDDGAKLSKLAMRCVHEDPLKRPTMNQVVGRLRKLYIIQNDAKVFGFGNVPTISNFSISGIRKFMKNYLKFYSKIEGKMATTLFWKQIGNDINQRGKKGLVFHPPIVLSYEHLKRFTNGFSDENYIDYHQFGKLFHGRIGSQPVTVKTLEDVGTCLLWEGDNESRLRDELVLLQHPRFVAHPVIVTLLGYCYEDGKLGVVYDLEPFDCLVNLIEKDDFTWRQRINFAAKLASVLKFLQDSKPPYTPYVLRNIFPNNILVDKEYNPKLFNFGRTSGGILNDKEYSLVRRAHSWLYYIDPYTNCMDYYTEVSDIYSFGMVLLNLITKKLEMDDERDFDHQWAYGEYERAASAGRWGLKRFTLVDNSFDAESDFVPSQGRSVSKLVMRCIDRDCGARPTIGQIVDYFEKCVIRQ